MITPNKNALNSFAITVTDSTVYVAPGSTQVGNNIISYQGGSITFDQMVNFDSSTNAYQYSALMLQNFYNWGDLTCVLSPIASSLADLQFPLVDPNLTNFAMSPIGLFLFKKDTTVSLSSYEKTAQGGGAGLQGATGIQGVQGDTGVQGQTGLQGPLGDTGVQGQTGMCIGLQGVTGATGVKGCTGIQGKTGVGMIGQRGVTGFPGVQGVTGATGTFLPGQNIVTSGYISSTSNYISAGGNIYTTGGNIYTTSGGISTQTGNINTNSGTIASNTGDIAAGRNITALGNSTVGGMRLTGGVSGTVDINVVSGKNYYKLDEKSNFYRIDVSTNRDIYGIVTSSNIPIGTIIILSAVAASSTRHFLLHGTYGVSGVNGFLLPQYPYTWNHLYLATTGGLNPWTYIAPFIFDGTYWILLNSIPKM